MGLRWEMVNSKSGQQFEAFLNGVVHWALTTQKYFGRGERSEI
jgi:hypothetical protein